MDVSNVASGTMQLQGIFGQHHRHHGSLADMIDQLKSTIDDAAKAGKLTDDQAADMKKTLDDIAELLKQNGSGAQVSADDRHQIRNELREIGKQLFAALSSQDAPSATSGGQVDDLFKAMDANGDGSIDKNELSGYLSQSADGNGALAGVSNGAGVYTQQASMSFSISYSQRTFTAVA